MTRAWLAASVVVCAATLGCEKDPARAVRIVERPAAAPARAPAPEPPPATSQAPSPSPSPRAETPAAKPAAGKPVDSAGFQLDACPPLPEEGSGTGSFAAQGPCAFRQRAAMNCEALADDFIMIGTRKGKNGATIMVYINVEKYAGPGEYTEAQMFVGVQEKKNIYRWSSDNVNITVGANEAFADLPSTKLEAEPILIDCSGPMNNFQCGGRESSDAYEKTIEAVAGRLTCGGAPPKESMND